MFFKTQNGTHKPFFLSNSDKFRMCYKSSSRVIYGTKVWILILTNNVLIHTVLLVPRISPRITVQCIYDNDCPLQILGVISNLTIHAWLVNLLIYHRYIIE